MNINIDRLMARIKALAEVGATGDGGVSRLALSEEDKTGRDLVVSLMRQLNLDVTIDQIGNVVGQRRGASDSNPIFTGSHIDTVRTGGRYDGALGVLAGLEVVATLNDHGITTERPIAVAFFTNEEGARFAPDMMGSMVHQGHLPVAEMLTVSGIDGTTVGENLSAIGYAGLTPCNSVKPHAFIELHIEQGPVLENNDVTIGVVEGVQGISWTEVNIKGQANHAGTTPMDSRQDAGFCAASIVRYARKIARDLGGDQVATVGYINMSPNVVNVIPGRVSMTVDLRNSDSEQLKRAQDRLYRFLPRLAKREGVYIARRSLASYPPVAFDSAIQDMLETLALDQGYKVMRLPSGAGHDAQAFAPNCPTGMIFVPSAAGISHNAQEHTSIKDIEAGANVLLQAILQLAVVSA